MDWYRPICSNIIFPLWAKWEKSEYLKHVEYLQEFQYKSTEQIKELQWKKIKSLLDHAYSNCPYYTKLFSNIGLHPDDIVSWSDFAKIPVLTKDEIRNNCKDLIAENISKNKLQSAMTSGSTGKPLHFVSDEKGLQWTRAHIFLTDTWAGWRRGEKRFAVSGIHANENTQGIRRYLRNRLLNRSFLLNTLELDDDSMSAFYKLLRKTDRPFIYGFAHAIHLFAQYLEEHNLSDIRACGVITGGMVLNEKARAIIEKNLHCRVFNRYGSEEMGVVACECERHEGLHISVGKYYVEILNGEKKDIPGEMGSLIITDLFNYGMPFIRYQIEDMAVVSDSMCKCGRTWPLIKEISGRTSDFIVTPEKKVISGISLTDFFATAGGIVQAQIVQNRIDHLIFKIVKSKEFNNDSIQKLKSIERRFFGNTMSVTYDYVENIPKEPGGKYRFVKSKIARDYFSYLTNS